MTIIRPNTKPALWWLFPWSYARTLHTAANALRALSDSQEEAIVLQKHIIADQSEEIANLRRQVASLCLERIAQKPTDDFTAFMVKLKDEHMNINEIKNHPNNTYLQR